MRTGTEPGAVFKLGERWEPLFVELDRTFASTGPASADANEDSDWLENSEDDDRQPL